MAATKSSVVSLASSSNAAAATTNSATLNLSTAYGAVFTGAMTNSASAPTLPCVATCQISADGTTFDTWQAATASIAASTVTPFAFEVPMHAIQARVSFSGNTGQAVTVVCRAQYTTAI